ncbi:hypothetical protein BD289DRAFT_452802 [Coniella lustricola]|uniref:Uncharacterized protein n=1 Tax=Coniella lustricola TaxID=2025994 RepID=A0A2T3A9W7_9PEZI|nr:hypothetical protein BD289DRAFT_452802 [Coniella lustricola]
MPSSSNSFDPQTGGQSLSDCAFSEESIAFGESKNHHPREERDCVSPLASSQRSLAWSPLPRQHRFQNLEEAHSHIVQSRQVSRCGSAEPHNASNSNASQDVTGEEPLLDPHAPFGTPTDGGILSIPVDAESVIEHMVQDSSLSAHSQVMPSPLEPRRPLALSSSPASQSSDDSVARFIARYSRLSYSHDDHSADASSYPLEAKSDFLVDHGEQEVLHTEGGLAVPRRIRTPFPRGFGRTPGTSPPHVALPELPGSRDVTSDPLDDERHLKENSTNATRVSVDSHGSDSTVSMIPILQRFDSEFEDYVVQKRKHGGRRRQDEPPTDTRSVPEAQSVVAQLAEPPISMHSVRHQQRGQRASSGYYSDVDSPSCNTSDLEPFPYMSFEQAPARLKKTEQHIVSAPTQQVSGLQRDNTASIWSEQTNHPSMYMDEAFLAGIAVKNHKHQQDFTKPHGAGQRREDRRLTHRESQPMPSLLTNMGSDFYYQSALRAEWVSKDKRTVKIPIINRDSKSNNEQGQTIIVKDMAAKDKQQGASQVTGDCSPSGEAIADVREKTMKELIVLILRHGTQTTPLSKRLQMLVLATTSMTRPSLSTQVLFNRRF